MLPSSGLVEGEDDLVRMMHNLLKAEAVLIVATWGRCCAKRGTEICVPCIIFFDTLQHWE